mmetsp:Transcript_41023/g.162270  ORF Transcript_41023/g.162270 Transcript_41023/m.162270 type:complete len:89 (-) Transcript_41023:117-383(-)
MIDVASQPRRRIPSSTVGALVQMEIAARAASIWQANPLVEVFLTALACKDAQIDEKEQTIDGLRTITEPTTLQLDESRPYCTIHLADH